MIFGNVITSRKCNALIVNCCDVEEICFSVNTYYKVEEDISRSSLIFKNRLDKNNLNFLCIML